MTAELIMYCGQDEKVEWAEIVTEIRDRKAVDAGRRVLPLQSRIRRKKGGVLVLYFPPQPDLNQQTLYNAAMSWGEDMKEFIHIRRLPAAPASILSMSAIIRR